MKQPQITLYGIPNCDTVKKARTWLSERSLDYVFHDFKKQGISLVWCLKSNHQIMVLAARATDAKMVSALLCHTNGLGSSL